MPLLADSINEYLLARQAQGFAANTIRNDRNTLRRLERVTGLADSRHIDAITIDTFMADLATTCGPGALNTHQATLAAYIKWAQARGHIPAGPSPLDGRRYRKTIPAERLMVPLGKFGAVLDSAERNHPRDRALVAVGMFLMLRQSEATDLRIRDLDLDAGRITVRIHKTRDLDTMPISSELGAELRRWLNHYTASVPGRLQPEWYLLPSRSSHAMIRNTEGHFVRSEPNAGLRPLARISRPYNVVRRALEGAGFTVGKHEGMHTLRRSGARAVYDELVHEGYDGALRTVQTLLHHAHTTMTERYIGITLDKQSRDKRFTDKPMFPSLAADNVVRLGRAEG